MKQFLYAALLLFSASFSVNAQQQHQHEHCWFDHVLNTLDQRYPGYKQAYDATFEEAKRTYAASDRGMQVYTINVIVHVVWNDTTENIPLSQIQDQIDVLNECYRRQNADANNLRQIFWPVAGDPMIEFNLSQVINVQTTATFDILADMDLVKQSAGGGSDAIDPAHYLNIWVCKIQPLMFGGVELGQVLGFAYPPAGLAHWPANSQAPQPEYDGVVIDYRAFGRGMNITMQGQTYPIEGRTPVHEVGHYLGLRHIWGDGQLAQFGIADCAASDGVDDTPFPGLPSNYECDTTRNSCNDSPVDLPDMVENYMDYSRETCQNTFTQGQIGIMRGVLEGPRIDLLAPVSVSTHQSSLRFSLSPNPAQDYMRVMFSGESSKRSDMICSITDMAGAVVYRSVINANTSTVEINTASLSAGFYMITLQNATGERFTQKFVKN